MSRSIYVVYRVAVTMELRSFDQCDVERLGEGEDVLDVDGPQIRKASAAHWQAPSKRPSKREYDNGEEVGKVKKKKKLHWPFQSSRCTNQCILRVVW